jgi:ABC-type sugar transport system ATPase subunit
MLDRTALGQPSAGAATKPILELRQITKSFGHVQALRGADFSLLPSEVMALVGDNGAGKSTLIKVIAGAYRPDTGDIFLDGLKVSFANPSAATDLGIATVYQDLALVDQRSVAANLFLGREPTKNWVVDRERLIADSQAILKRLKIRIPSVHALVGGLSGGQRQAVAIGRTMAQNSRIVILDEPTAALGVEQQQFVLELVGELKAEGKSVILISHNVGQVMSVSDRITVMRGGVGVGVRRKLETTSDEIVKMIVGTDQTVARE